MTTKETQLLSKISAKAIVGNVKNLVPKNDGEERPLFRVLGIADGLKSGTSNFGEWLAFTGQFKAVNLENGLQYRSGKVFLPNVATDLLAPVVRGNDGPVEFAFDIGVKADSTSSVGYQFTVKPIVAIAESDLVSRLESALPAIPALAAPKAEAPVKTKSAVPEKITPPKGTK